MKKVYRIDYDKCDHRSCGRICQTHCPVVLTNSRKKSHEKKLEEPIRLKKTEDRIIIVGEYCLKCGICVNTCPRKAISVLNLLSEPDNVPLLHEYEGSHFKVYGLPVLVPEQVVGFCGPNGIGKSTIMNILAGKLLPNFGNKDEIPTLDTVAKNFKNNFMRQLYLDLKDASVKIAFKEQVLRILFDRYEGKTVKQILEAHIETPPDFTQEIFRALDIPAIENRYLKQCSGGELQRFAIALVMLQNSDILLIDEPCTFLDVKKRFVLAELLQKKAHSVYNNSRRNAIAVVEHDLTVLDYLSDSVQLFYGEPHVFGVVTTLKSTKNGINSYLDGYLKAENIQFREQVIGFKKSVSDRDWKNNIEYFHFFDIDKTFPGGFSLHVSAGTVYQSEILGIVGENGCGKSTFAKLLIGEIKPDNDSMLLIDRELQISYKPQYITKDFDGTAKEFIMNFSQNYDFSEGIMRLIYEPLGADGLFEKRIVDLSGGELQRVFIAACLAKRADLYILDEPSAYLDVEERLKVSSVIRSCTKARGATAICVEHDIQICDALADRLLLFTGQPGVKGYTIGPLGKRDGMNEFLKILDVTFRRDEENGRARINKKGSSLDLEQRANNEYFYV